MAKEQQTRPYYETTPAVANPRHLRLMTIDEFRLENGGVLVPHRHLDIHQIVFIPRGSCQAILDDAEIWVQAPALCLIPPPVIHVFHMDSDSLGLSLSMGNGLILDLAAHLEQGSQAIPNRWVLLQGAALQPHLEQISCLYARIEEELNDKQPHYEAAARAHAGNLLVQILRLQAKSSAQQKARRGHDTYSKFLQLIERSLHARWSVSRYAEALQINERTLQRVCRATSGKKPLEIIQQRMLLEAKRLLLYTNHNVSSISQQLGFEDPSYFSQYFTRLAGTTPSEYRASHRKRINA